MCIQKFGLLCFHCKCFLFGCKLCVLRKGYHACIGHQVLEEGGPLCPIESRAFYYNCIHYYYSPFTFIKLNALKLQFSMVNSQIISTASATYSVSPFKLLNRVFNSSMKLILTNLKLVYFQSTTSGVYIYLLYSFFIVISRISDYSSTILLLYIVICDYPSTKPYFVNSFQPRVWPGC